MKLTLKMFSSTLLLATFIGSNGHAQSMHPYLEETKQVFDDDTEQSEAEFHWILQTALLDENLAVEIIESGQAFNTSNDLKAYGFLEAILLAGNASPDRFPELTTLELEEKGQLPFSKMSWLRQADKQDLIAEFLVQLMINAPTDSYYLSFGEEATIEQLISTLQQMEGAEDLVDRHLNTLLNSLVQSVAKSEAKSVMLINSAVEISSLDSDRYTPLVFDRLANIMFKGRKDLAGSGTYDRLIEALTLLLPQLPADKRDRQVDQLFKGLENPIYGVRAPFEAIKLLGDAARLSPPERRVEIITRLERVKARKDYSETDKVFLQLEPLIGRLESGDLLPADYYAKLEEIWSPYLGDRANLYLNAEVQGRTQDVSFRFLTRQSEDVLQNACKLVSDPEQDPESIFEVYDQTDIAKYDLLFTACLDLPDSNSSNLLKIMSYGFGSEDYLNAFLVSFLNTRITRMSGPITENDANNLVSILENAVPAVDSWDMARGLIDLAPTIGQLIAPHPGSSDEFITNIWNDAYDGGFVGPVQREIIKHLLPAASSDAALDMFDTFLLASPEERPETRGDWHNDLIVLIAMNLTTEMQIEYVSKLTAKIANSDGSAYNTQALAALAGANANISNRILDLAIAADGSSELQSRYIDAFAKVGVGDWDQVKAEQFADRILAFAQTPGLNNRGKIKRLAGLRALSGYLSPERAQNTRMMVLEALSAATDKEDIILASNTSVALWPNQKDQNYVQDWLTIELLPYLSYFELNDTVLEAYLAKYEPELVGKFDTLRIESLLQEDELASARKRALSILDRQSSAIDELAP